MKKTIVILLLTITLMSIVIFTGCANKILYGSWQVKETIDAETYERHEQMFANIMIFTINRDGTVFFMDKLFGTYTKSRNEFHFVEAVADDDEEDKKYIDMTGAWILDGSDLYIYPDSEPYIYHLVAVIKKEE